MLTVGIILILLASLIGGWVFMCDSLPLPPKLAWTPAPLFVAVLVGVVGITVLFFVKWYMGLVAIIGVIVGFNLFASIWHVIYKYFRL